MAAQNPYPLGFRHRSWQEGYEAGRADYFKSTLPEPEAPMCFTCATPLEPTETHPKDRHGRIFCDERCRSNSR